MKSLKNLCILKWKHELKNLNILQYAVLLATIIVSNISWDSQVNTRRNVFYFQATFRCLPIPDVLRALGTTMKLVVLILCLKKQSRNQSVTRKNWLNIVRKFMIKRFWVFFSWNWLCFLLCCAGCSRYLGFCFFDCYKNCYSRWYAFWWSQFSDRWIWRDWRLISSLFIVRLHSNSVA